LVSAGTGSLAVSSSVIAWSRDDRHDFAHLGVGRVGGVIGGETGQLKIVKPASDAMFSGPNTYAGTTTSTARLEYSTCLGPGSTVAGTTVASGGTLQLQGGSTSGAEALAIAASGRAVKPARVVNVTARIVTAAC